VREIELKLEFDPADVARMRAHPLLAATNGQRKTLHSTYYDTADLDLRKAGVSLRVRDTDGRLVQTIKSGVGDAGLFDRSEWEHEVKGRDIDLIAASGTALEPLLSARVRNALRPVFETRVNRTVYQLTRNGSEIEVALDRGEVAAGGRQAAINEIELELKHGEPADGGSAQQYRPVGDHLHRPERRPAPGVEVTLRVALAHRAGSPS
jgi:inorganic triphosphatase YgiF